MELPPGLYVEEFALGASQCRAADELSRALKAVFLDGEASAPPLIANLSDGLMMVGQISSAPRAAEATSTWSARLCGHTHGGCRLTLLGPESQELDFTLDCGQRLYGGFTWLQNDAAYVFHAVRHPAGWSLRMEDRESEALLSHAVPWTQDPARASQHFHDETDNGSPFSGWVRAAVTAAALLKSARALRPAEAARDGEGVCAQCGRAFKAKAKFCVQCGAAITRA